MSKSLQIAFWFLADSGTLDSTLNRRLKRNSSNKLLLAKVSFTFYFDFRETNLALAQKENFTKFVFTFALRRTCTRKWTTIFIFVLLLDFDVIIAHGLFIHSFTKTCQSCWAIIAWASAGFSTRLLTMLNCCFSLSVDTLTWLVIPFNLSTIRLIVTLWLTISCK